MPKLSEKEEKEFQKWYSKQAKKFRLAPNPDDPLHFYDYRAAFKAGAKPGKDFHWPSKFKKTGHPNRFVNGIDTITGKPATDFDILDNIITNQATMQRIRMKQTPSKHQLEMDILNRMLSPQTELGE